MSESLELARLLIQQKRFQQAELEARAAVATSDDTATAYSYLSLAFLGQDRIDDAKQAARQAVAADPSYAFSFFVRARVLRVAGENKEAENSIREALKIRPEEPAFFEELAWVLLAQDRYQDALEVAEQGLEHESDNVELRQARTEAFVHLRQLDAAAQSAHDALRLDPEDSDSLTQLGYVSLRQNDHALAQTHFLEALRLDPENTRAKEGLVITLKARNPLFRVVLNFTNWMRSLSPRVRWLVILGAYALSRVGGPILLIYLVFVYLTWTADPLATLLLRLSPIGRAALSKDDIRASDLVGIALLIAIGCVIGSVVTRQVDWFLAAMAWGMLVLPVAGSYNTSGRKRIGSFVYAGFCALLAAGGLIGVIGGAQSAASLFGLAIFLCFIYTWIAAIFLWK